MRATTEPARKVHAVLGLIFAVAFFLIGVLGMTVHQYVPALLAFGGTAVYSTVAYRAIVPSERRALARSRADAVWAEVQRAREHERLRLNICRLELCNHKLRLEQDPLYAMEWAEKEAAAKAAEAEAIAKVQAEAQAVIAARLAEAGGRYVYVCGHRARRVR